MFDNDTRLRELSLKAIEGTMSDEEFVELSQLSKAKQKVREDRATMIAELRNTMGTHGIAIQDLFSVDEITSALPSKSSLGRRVSRTKSTPTQRSAGTWVRQKSGVVLVEVNLDGSNGFPTRYCMGQRLPHYLPKGLKVLDDGQLETNLARHFTETGKQYFATEAGKAELDQLLRYIGSHDIKPRLRLSSSPSA